MTNHSKGIKGIVNHDSAQEFARSFVEKNNGNRQFPRSIMDPHNAECNLAYCYLISCDFTEALQLKIKQLADELLEYENGSHM